MTSNCEECLTLFESGLEGVALQIQVDKVFPHFACERCSISRHSPCEVGDDESVIFLNIHPIHFDDESGTLLPIAFEQLTRNDLSLMRQNYCTRVDIDNTAASLMALGKGDRKIEKCCVVNVNAIRSLKDPDGRVLGVYDTALADKPFHASVFARSDYLGSKKERAAIRFKAFDVFSPGLTNISALDFGTPANENSG